MEPFTLKFTAAHTRSTDIFSRKRKSLSLTFKMAQEVLDRKEEYSLCV